MGTFHSLLFWTTSTVTPVAMWRGLQSLRAPSRIHGFSRNVIKRRNFVRSFAASAPQEKVAQAKTLSDDVPSFKEFLRTNSSSEPSGHDSESDGVTAPINAQLQNASQAGDSQKFSIETYGCQMNVSDTEIVTSILEGAGFEQIEDSEEADIVLLNTCAVRDNAERRVWGKLQQMRSDDKQKRRRRIVGVLGCMAERLKEELLEDKKLVQIVAGPDAYRDLPRLVAIVNGSGGDEQAINVQLSQDETYADVAPVRTNKSRVSAFVSIMRGCNNMCTYCIVPFTRGRERSRDVASIVAEVEELSRQGVKEVWLLGQNVNSYHDRKTQSMARAGHDQDSGSEYKTAAGFTNLYRSRGGAGVRFEELLDRVSAVDPEMRIRFTSPHPKVSKLYDLLACVCGLLTPANNDHSGRGTRGGVTRTFRTRYFISLLKNQTFVHSCTCQLKAAAPRCWRECESDRICYAVWLTRCSVERWILLIFQAPRIFRRSVFRSCTTRPRDNSRFSSLIRFYLWLLRRNRRGSRGDSGAHQRGTLSQPPVTVTTASRALTQFHVTGTIRTSIPLCLFPTCQNSGPQTVSGQGDDSARKHTLTLARTIVLISVDTKTTLLKMSN